jgi:hypothetical protein
MGHTLRGKDSKVRPRDPSVSWPDNSMGCAVVGIPLGSASTMSSTWSSFR